MVSKPKRFFRKICRIIFGRTTAVFLFLLIQVLLMILVISSIALNNDYYYFLSVILSVIAAIYIINDKTSTAFKLAWIVPVLALPIFGILLYLFVKLQFGSRLVNKRLLYLTKSTRKYLDDDSKILAELKLEDRAEYNFARYMSKYAFFPVYRNVSSRYFPSGEAKFEALLKELRAAKKFIFMEYFIIEDGEMWSAILDVLRQKAAEGIEVRVMYDGTNTIHHVPYNYHKKLNAMGIKCKVFSPIKPVLSTVQNNRNHRKIVVIDGLTAFTGGVNLSDEYINAVTVFGYWKDTAIMLRGEAVKSFTIMFLQNWNITAKKEDNYSNYISDKYNYKYDEVNNGYVIPYSDSPLDDETVGKEVYIDILNRAERYVHIMTPYLIVDESMLNALTFAAKRGVDVVILMPHIYDKKMPYLLARTYYKELLDAGVKIFEYTDGFVHAKVFVCDDKRAVVGSINLDYRSLYLHFECAAYIYKCESIINIEIDFLEMLEKSQFVTYEYCEKLSVPKKIIGRILRMIAPLM